MGVLKTKTTDLENADLENADPENTDLQNADLENAGHKNADLENAWDLKRNFKVQINCAYRGKISSFQKFRDDFCPLVHKIFVHS